MARKKAETSGKYKIAMHRQYFVDGDIVTRVDHQADDFATAEDAQSAIDELMAQSYDHDENEICRPEYKVVIHNNG